MRIYRCKKCGWICSAEPNGSIGTAHSHAEKHVGMKILGYELPAAFTISANPRELGKVIEELQVENPKIIQENTTQKVRE